MFMNAMPRYLFFLAILLPVLNIFAQVPEMNYVFNNAQNMQGWKQTKGTDVNIKEGYVALTSSNWDGKIFRIVNLPAGRYNIYGEGSGNITVYLRPADFKSRMIPGINLSHPTKWRTDYRDFEIPKGRYAIVVKVSGPKHEARIKWLKVEIAPKPADEIEQTPTPQELGKYRPSPPMVRGFMVGYNLDDEDYAEMKRWGVNVVRVQFRPTKFAKKMNKSLWEAFPEQLKVLEEQVILAKNHGIKVVLDLHWPLNENGRVDRNQWDDPNFEANMIRGWKEIVTFMLPYREHIWGYELWNEPLDRMQLPWAPQKWRKLAIKIVKAIRKIDTQSWIIYGPGPGGMWRGIENLIPLPDTRIIYTVHWYTPSSFTHQGVYVKAATDLSSASEQINKRYPGENQSNIGKVYWDKEKFQSHLQPVVDFVNKWNVPMFIGEFSVVRWAPVPDGANWLRDSIDIFEENNWSWTYHAFKEWPGWSLEHPSGPKGFWYPGLDHKKLITKAEKETDRAAVVKSYFKRNANLASPVTLAPDKDADDEHLKSQLEVVDKIAPITGADALVILYLGNSITRHGFNKNTIDRLGWGHVAGMAATEESKDYVHLFAAAVQKIHPDKKVVIRFRNKNIEALKPDVVVVQWGEHERPADGPETLQAKYSGILTPMQHWQKKPLILCVGVWNPSGKGKKTAYTDWALTIEQTMAQVCQTLNIPFASMSKHALNPANSGWGTSEGVKWHPNNAGMQAYADELIQMYQQAIGDQ